MRGFLTIAKMNSLASLSQGMLSQKRGCLGDMYWVKKNLLEKLL